MILKVGPHMVFWGGGGGGVLTNITVITLKNVITNITISFNKHQLSFNGISTYSHHHGE